MARTDKTEQAEPIMTNEAALRVLHDLAKADGKTWDALRSELVDMLGGEMSPTAFNRTQKENGPWPSGFGPKEYGRAFLKYAREFPSHYGALAKVKESLESSNAYTPQVRDIAEGIQPDACEWEITRCLKRVMEAIFATARSETELREFAESTPRENERVEGAGPATAHGNGSAFCGSDCAADLPGFMSVEEAESCVDTPEGRMGAEECFRKAALSAPDPDNDIFGTAIELFNHIISHLCDRDYFTALKLSYRALELYPYNVDLISATLQAANGCAQFGTCAGLLERACLIPKEIWNWRLFFFTIEYYQAYLYSCDPGLIWDVFEKALAVAHDFQHYLPLDERGYDKEAELLLYANRAGQAQEVLERAIFGKVTLADGTTASLVAPQCCVTMLDKVLGDSTDYELIARVARRGLRNTAQDQPSADAGYFMYREALALDAAVCNEADERDGFRNGGRVREALVAYRCAYGMLEGRPELRTTIERRYPMLCNKGGVTDMPLKEE